MCCELEFDTGVFESCTAPWSSSKHENMAFLHRVSLNAELALKDDVSFTASPRATCSASDVERVTYFCVLEKQQIHVPHINTSRSHRLRIDRFDEDGRGPQ